MPRLTAARSRRVLTSAALALALALASVLLDSGPAEARGSAPSAKTFTIKGAGYGHGYGMSQYGAYGAARAGLSWKQIVNFYYPGTSLGTVANGTALRVWITADDDENLKVLPAAGLRVTDGDGGSYAVPSGAKYTSWRITRSGSGSKLSYRNSDGVIKSVTPKLASGTWAFKADHPVKVVLPNGWVREFRGSVSLVKSGSSARTVNRVGLEDYVRSVVPSEMPTSWAVDAVRTQAVAARSYAMRLRDFGNYSGYDICDTTACQVYGGVATTKKGQRTVRETKAGNAATQATAGRIVTYKGAVALTQFASSNGGATAQGGFPYLKAHSDPYDNDIVSQAWTKEIGAPSVSKKWPEVGSVRSLEVTTRDGSGRWGGRAKKVKIIGSARTITVSGGAFQSAFGLRSTLFTFTN